MSTLARLTPNEDAMIAARSIEDDARCQLSDVVRGILATAAKIRCATNQDPIIRKAFTYVRISWPTTAPTDALHQLILRRALLSAIDICLIVQTG
ncbi:unnamed protein product [Dibothriocephalus latus]|uniref:Uncharacterized protein n=1 Tax=Dibothriocephalus latus TaxID=60516 RepID=A0A3P7L8X4_DIBLA|nr:unnamed protein product [Dibothriocephalus latus]